MPDVSFEIYPPKSKEGSLQLRQAMRQLAKFDPKFTSVTCGTGGGSVKSTKDTVQALQAQEIGEIGAHVTCGNRTLADLTGLTHYYRQNNVSAVVALRGDAPSDISNGPTVPEFVSTLRRTTNLDIYVAAYPQVHPKARNLATDLDALKEKQDAGANAAITQFFFDADVFLRFRDLAIANGVTMPLIPGILPVTNWAATRSMAIACGATIEPDLAEGFAR
ncbi:MAG: methylenetetrahydrofolate reductase, partial [Planktomarina sp.]